MVTNTPPPKGRKEVFLMLDQQTKNKEIGSFPTLTSGRLHTYFPKVGVFFCHAKYCTQRVWGPFVVNKNLILIVTF